MDVINTQIFEKIQASDSLIPNTPSLFAYIILFMQVIFT